MKMDCGGGASLPPMLEIRGPTTCPLGCGEVERRTDSAGISEVLSVFEFSPHRAASDHS